MRYTHRYATGSPGGGTLTLTLTLTLQVVCGRRGGCSLVTGAYSAFHTVGFSFFLGDSTTTVDTVCMTVACCDPGRALGSTGDAAGDAGRGMRRMSAISPSDETRVLHMVTPPLGLADGRC